MPANPKKRPARPSENVPRLERVLSLVVIVLLAGIAVAVAVKGRHYDPNLYQLDPAALTQIQQVAETATNLGAEAEPALETAPAYPASTTESIDETYGEAGYEGYGWAPRPGDESAASAAAPQQNPLDLDLDGLEPMSPTEFYNADTLYEKINGRAPAYFEFDFQSLRARSFTINDQPGAFIDVFDYDMGSPINAFGIFSLERDPDGRPVEFAGEGYRSPMGYFLRQGAHYIQIIASDETDATMRHAEAAARAMIESIPADDAGLAARRRLPQAGLLPDTIEYAAKNFQGQGFLSDVFSAQYTVGDAQVTFFVMMAGSPADAADAFVQYRQFNEQFGAIESVREFAGAQVFQADSFGKTNVVYQRGAELGGVVNAADPALAREFVEQYLQQPPDDNPHDR